MLVQLRLGGQQRRHLGHKPRIELGLRHHLGQGPAGAQGLGHREQPLGGRDAQSTFPHSAVLGLQLASKARHADLQPADGFVKRLGEGAADGHYLAHRLHLRAERFVRTGELFEIPARDLDHAVVEAGLEGGGRHTGDVVGDLIERVAHGQQRRDLGDGEAGGLGSQRRRAADTRVHFNHERLAGARIDRELHIAAAGLDAHGLDDRARHVAQPLILAIRQGLRGGDGDAVAGVYAHRVDVLDRAHHHEVVGPVAHDLQLVLFPAQHRLLDQHLADGRFTQAKRRQAAQLGRRARDAAARATERKRGPDEARIAHLLRHGLGFGQGARQAGQRHRQAGGQHRFLELEAVFGQLDGARLRADQLHAILRQHPGPLKVHGQVQPGLPAHGRQQRIGPLGGDDLLDNLDGERLDVRGIGQLGVGHDGGRVRVDQDDAVALAPERLARLHARVIELATLADDDGAGAEDQDGVYVGAFRQKGNWQMVNGN